MLAAIGVNKVMLKLTERIRKSVKPLMTLSVAGLADLVEEEGVRYSWYLDTQGKPTVGVGHLLTTSEMKHKVISLPGGRKLNLNQPLTYEEVTALLDYDLTRFYKAVNKVRRHINQGQFDALVSFAFNIGVAGFNRSTARKMIVQDKHKQVPDAMLLWNKPKEIIGRRTREAEKYAKHSGEY